MGGSTQADRQAEGFILSTELALGKVDDMVGCSYPACMGAFGFRELNSCPHACRASGLLAEPSISSAPHRRLWLLDLTRAAALQ